jgi:hypothetical protein
MSPETLHVLLALLLGFAFGGLCSTAYQLATQRLPSFSLLSRGPKPSTFPVQYPDHQDGSVVRAFPVRVSRAVFLV